MPLLEAKNVTKTYKQGSKVINANEDINLSVAEGEFIVIIGHSGSGKSTLLQMLGGLDRPTKGHILMNGKDISRISEAKLTKVRRKMYGFIFQNFNLIPTLTASQNIEAAINKRSKKDVSRCRDMLKVVGLSERSDHIPSLLSGGEQQRVAIARALINDPKIIFADEPTGNLDSKTGAEIMSLLQDLHKNQGKTIILITHSEYVRRLANHVYEIKDGKLHPVAYNQHAQTTVNK